MKKILVIQSRKRPEMIQAEQGEYTRAIPQDCILTFISSLDETVAWHNPLEILADYNAVILGGSGEFDFDGGREAEDVACCTSREIVNRLRTLILYVIEMDFPLLGICYGHQIVSEVLGVKVVNDHTQKKVGSYEVTLTDAGKKDMIFSKLPETLMAQYGHKDSLSALPQGAVLLATGNRCKTSALRLKQNIYTMQFHPELTAEDSCLKLSRSPGYLPEGVDVSSIIKPSIEASRIIPLFIETVVQ